jgi:hypothetical protein
VEEMPKLDIETEVPANLPDMGNVTVLFPRDPTPLREPPASQAELAEYRRLRPLLLQMLKEWEAIKGSGGCPVARQIVG